MHVLPRWVGRGADPDADDDSDGEEPKRSTIAPSKGEMMLGWVPSKLMRVTLEVRAENDAKVYAERRVRIVDEILLGTRKTVSASNRAKILEMLWAKLSEEKESADDNEAILGFRALLVDQRRRLQALVNQFLQARRAKDSTAASSTLAQIGKEYLCTVDVVSGGASRRVALPTALLALADVPDRIILRKLAITNDPCHSRGEIKDAMKDMVSRVGSRSDCARAIKMLVYRGCMLTICQDEVGYMIRRLQGWVGKCERSLQSLAALLCTLFRGFPRLMLSKEVMCLVPWMFQTALEFYENASSDGGDRACAHYVRARSARRVAIGLRHDGHRFWYWRWQRSGSGKYANSLDCS